MMTRIGVLLLIAMPLAAQTASNAVHKFLPLAVGNSWTYEHLVVDDRHNHSRFGFARRHRGVE